MNTENHVIPAAASEIKTDASSPTAASIAASSALLASAAVAAASLATAATAAATSSASTGSPGRASGANSICPSVSSLMVCWSVGRLVCCCTEVQSRPRSVGLAAFEKQRLASCGVGLGWVSSRPHRSPWRSLPPTCTSTHPPVQLLKSTQILGTLCTRNTSHRSYGPFVLNVSKLFKRSFIFDLSRRTTSRSTLQLLRPECP